MLTRQQYAPPPHPTCARALTQGEDPCAGLSWRCFLHDQAPREQVEHRTVHGVCRETTLWGKHCAMLVFFCHTRYHPLRHGSRVECLPYHPGAHMRELIDAIIGFEV